MRSVKGKLLRKLKSIKPVDYLNPDRVLQAFSIDGFIDSFPKIQNPNEQPKLLCKESEQEKINESFLKVEEQAEIVDVAEQMKDHEADDYDEEIDLNDDVEDKENIRPTMVANIDVVEKENVNIPMKFENAPLSEIDVSSFRKPDLNSCTLFDPNLLTAFEQAVKEHMKMSEYERKARIEQENLEKISRGAENQARIEEISVEKSEDEPPHKTRRIDDNHEVDVDEDDDGDGDPLLGFEEKCPPGGEASVILYTTTLQGIRKTFQDCSSVRFLLESFRVIFYERDVSMHAEYKEELWRILGGKIMPPRLFIKGRYIGGAEQILALHEQGKLKLLFQGIGVVDTSNGPCEGCAGIRFMLCFKCNGSHRIIADDGLSTKCLQCNENGLIICPICN